MSFPLPRRIGVCLETASFVDNRRAESETNVSWPNHFFRTLNMPSTLGLLTALMLAFVPTSGAGFAAHLNAVTDSVPSLARFLAGSWRCTGGTPSGRVLIADVEFTMTLGDRFIQSGHRDQPPGRYMSLALWPTDTAPRRQATVVYDNFGGHRRFFADRWSADSIVWVRDTTEEKARMETFTYKRTSPDAYWYAWHVGRPAAAGFVLGDSATCRRKS
jgi:hypothetical protein